MRMCGFITYSPELLTQQALIDSFIGKNAIPGIVAYSIKLNEYVLF